MLGRETHGMDVSFKEGIPHTFFTTCSKGSMGYGMATRATHFFPYEVSHMMDMMPHDDEFQLIIYGDVWASMICRFGGEVFGDLVLTLPLEGKLIVAHE